MVIAHTMCADADALKNGFLFVGVYLCVCVLSLLSGAICTTGCLGRTRASHHGVDIHLQQRHVVVSVIGRYNTDLERHQQCLRAQHHE